MSENGREVFRIINEAGAIIDSVFDGDKLRITRKSSDDYINRTTELNKDEQYVKVYISNWKDVTRRLDSTVVQFLLMLLPYIGYEDGILQYPNGRILTRNAVISESGMSKNTVNKCLLVLQTEQIIGKHKTGRRSCFTVNPYIFMKGRRVNKTLKKLFEKSRWAKS